jgi:hypothetical protein
VDGERLVRIGVELGRQSRCDPVTVANVCAAAVAAVHVDGAGVTVMAGPTVRDSVHATDLVAGALEERQLASGEGPCVDAFTTGRPVLVVDLDSPEYVARWPAFTPAALDTGARALFALPLQTGAIRLGVLDLYRVLHGALSPPELADALAYAETAGMLLLDAMAGTHPDIAALAWQCDDPAAHQAQVHQATGLILAQLGVSADVAFARLRAYAYAEERPLGDVARDVVERRLRFEADPPYG